MSESEIIDMHMHTYHTAEAGRLSLAQTPARTNYVGTIEEALIALEKGNVAKGLMVNTIPLAYMKDRMEASLAAELSKEQRQQAEKEIRDTLLARLLRRNQWTCQAAKENPKLFATITLDPIYMTPELMRQEIRDKVNNHGAKALKIHPPIGRFYPNDHRLWPAYEVATELDIPIVFHCGPHPHPVHPEQPVEYSRPSHYEEVISSFPNLTIVLAHMGGSIDERYSYLYQTYYNETLTIGKKYPTLYFDISATVDSRWPEEDLLAAIRQLGAERILFGSDFPWWEPAQTTQRVTRLGLDKEEKRLIFADNAKRVFKLF